MLSGCSGWHQIFGTDVARPIPLCRMKKEQPVFKTLMFASFDNWEDVVEADRPMCSGCWDLMDKSSKAFIQANCTSVLPVREQR